MKNILSISGVAFGIALVMAVTGPAHADDHHARGRPAAGARDWRGHEGRNQHDWHGPGYAPAGVIYAPPVVYAPPQYEAPGLNLIIPLNFR